MKLRKLNFERDAMPNKHGYPRMNNKKHTKSRLKDKNGNTNNIKMSNALKDKFVLVKEFMNNMRRPTWAGIYEAFNTLIDSKDNVGKESKRN